MPDLTENGLAALSMFSDEWGSHPLRANRNAVKKLIRDGLVDEDSITIRDGNVRRTTNRWRRTEAGRQALAQARGEEQPR